MDRWPGLQDRLASTLRRDINGCMSNRPDNVWPQAVRGTEKKTQLGKSKLAGVTGLEPATSAVTGQRSEPVELHPQPVMREIRNQNPEVRNRFVSNFDTRNSYFPVPGGEWALKDLNL